MVIPSGFEDPENAALAAIRAAHANPRLMSAEEEAEFYQSFRRSTIRRVETIRLIRRGELVFRLKGKRGADLPCHPLEWERRHALGNFQRALRGDIRQTPDPFLGVRARQTKAQARAQRVLSLYPFYAHRGRAAASLIAKRLGEKEHYVRRILRESVHDRKNRFPQ